MVRETHTAAATTVDSEEVAGDGLLEEHLLPGDLLVRGDELLEDGDHVTMPAGVSCFSEMVKGERSTSTSMTMMCLGLASSFFPLSFLSFQDGSHLLLVGLQIYNIDYALTTVSKLGYKMCSLYLSANLTSHLPVFFLNGFNLESIVGFRSSSLSASRGRSFLGSETLGL